MRVGTKAWRVLFALPILAGPGARAQEPSKPPAAPAGDAAAAISAIESGSTPAAATVEKIMEQAVQNIARRYNLNEAQTQETDKLMKREVHRFLKEHESEVWPIIRDLLAAQLGARPPNSREETMRIGKAAQPLVNLAKEAILRANDEWRVYLNAEQRAVHDYDLADIERQFQKIDKNFSDWAAGQPTDEGLFPPPAVEDRSPPRPRKPPGGLPEPEIELFRDSLFDTFVEEFIKDYQLDQGQIDSARSILKEFKAKAKDFRKANKEEEGKITAELKAAQASRDTESARAAEKKRKKFLEPITALFVQMDERLKGLLTSTQRDKYAARKTPIPRDLADPPAKTEVSPQEPAPPPAPEKSAEPGAPSKTGSD